VQKYGREPISLHTPLGEDGDSEFGDLIEDSEAIQPGEAVSFTLLQEQLHSVLDTLSEREAGVVSMRFGLTDGQPKTLDEIGKVYGVTRERIRQIESKTMQKLRHPARAQVLRDYLDEEPPKIGSGGYAGGGGSGGEPPYSRGGGSGREPSYSGGGDRQRYLRGRYPESIPVGEPFALLASVVLVAGPGSAGLKPFDVPREGRDVRLEAYVPPGLRLLGRRLLTVHVPADGDSEPVMFELRADAPGVRAVSVTAWIDGSYLGELRVDITAEHGHPAGTDRDVLAEITAEPTEGAVSLVVRFDSRQNAYRFEFRDEDNPDEVTSNLAYEPGPRVEQLIAGLEALAKGRSGHKADQARAHLVNSGAALWHELVPKGLRDQFWERQNRIRQLTILADKDAVPWELLYPMDPGCDKGFLVEQFPVTRAIFGRRPTRKLSLWPARFVLPEGSLPEARAEIDAMRVSLDPGQPLEEVISGPMPLQDLIASGDFGLLHFACHNTYDPVGGSSIKLGNVPFTPTDMASAAINKVLARSAPTVFINACRSAGLNATYNRLDGWATKFLEAGAAAFIGSLWAVSDGAAREFAQELYGQLQAGSSLGQAVKCARAAAAGQPDDPTWLAYTVYGDPRATLGQNRP
jgi:CHAT domain/Sigma-70, region 4/Sigma-70 region 3